MTPRPYIYKPPPKKTIFQRWAEKVGSAGLFECWPWHGARTKLGYGFIWKGGWRSGNKAAHRFAYEHFIGPIPIELEIDHLCRNPNCVNPLHLQAVTQKVNLLREI